MFFTNLKTQTTKRSLYGRKRNQTNDQRQSDNCLTNTGFLGFSNCKKGKVRDTYNIGDDRLLIVTTDRQSAFDRLLANVPFKGQVLNLDSVFWFEKTRDIVPNHLLSVPDPNAVWAKKCQVIPIEMVVRGYLTGSTSTSAWTHYEKGEREICGNILPDGMVKNQKFAEPIITPTTKSEVRDEPISAEEIVRRKILDQKTWEQLEEIVFKLFERGTQIAERNSLILVDTKYEFGFDNEDKLTLIDEIHTPDSSRYWLANTYVERFGNRMEPENIDKEFLRLWFKNNCNPYNDKILPKAPADLVEELSFRYIKLYEMITGKEFDFYAGSIQERMEKNLLQ
jgi:phosphoribosylaminoimidazole-succinocarboxamide synthase